MDKLQFYSVDFKKGRVLTTEIMNRIQSKSELFLKQFEEYPDGVLKGLKITCGDNGLELSAGIAKLSGQVYLLEEKVILTEEMSRSGLTEKHKYSLVIRRSKDSTSEESIEIKNAALTFTENPTDNDVLLGEFQYVENHRYELYSSTDDPEQKLKDTLNNDVFFSVAVFSNALISGQTFPAEIFQLMAECLRKKEKKTQLEAMFLIQIYQNECLPLSVLEVYIDRYSSKMTDKSPKSYISGFLDALKKAEEYVQNAPVEVKKSPEPQKDRFCHLHDDESAK